MTTEIEKLEAELTEMLKRPWEWEYTEFELEHQSGLSLWIANDDYGLELCQPLGVKFPKPMKKRLWALINSEKGSFQQWKIRQVRNELKRYVKPPTAKSSESQPPKWYEFWK